MSRGNGSIYVLENNLTTLEGRVARNTAIAQDKLGDKRFTSVSSFLASNQLPVGAKGSRAEPAADGVG